MAEAELTTIARPYARAAFTHAIESGDPRENLAKWSRMLGLLASALEQDVIRARLDDPMLTSVQEAAFLEEFLSGELDQHAQNFVQTLAQYGRIALLPEIAVLFELLKAEHEKTVKVEVRSAFESTEAELTSLAETLHRYLQREVELSTTVDPSLLGGVIVKAEDTVIDFSIRGKLGKLSQALS